MGRNLDWLKERLGLGGKKVSTLEEPPANGDEPQEDAPPDAEEAPEPDEEPVAFDDGEDEEPNEEL